MILADSKSWFDRLPRVAQSAAANEDRHLFKELNPDMDRTPIMKGRSIAKPRRAAVLIPVLQRDAGPTIIFTVRPSTMPSHAGEISLPGGGITESDGSAINAALRENEEEIGVSREAVQVLGEFGTHFGGLGFAVTPVLGLVDPAAQIIPCEREVDEVFEVPLSFLVDVRNHIVETRTFGDQRYNMFAVPFQDGEIRRHIWGLTAGILDTFAKAYHDIPLKR